MRKSNGRLNARTLAIFLVVLSLVNIGILMALRHNGTATTKEERETNDAMELYESVTADEPVVDAEEPEDATEDGITAEAPAIKEDVSSDDDDVEETEEPSPTPEETAKPTAKQTQSEGGPSLIYNEELVPTVTQKDLDSLAELYINSGALTALDADGNDISNDIKGVYSADPNQRLRFYATFLVDDSSSQRAKIDTSFNLNVTGPVIVLNSYSIKLNKGDSFDPDSYILLATDADGNDLVSGVTTRGKVNTSKPGRYVVQYRLNDGNETFVTNLAVKVVES